MNSIWSDQSPSLDRRVKLVDIVRGCIVDEETTNKINIGRSPNKSVFLTTSRIFFAFRDNFSPVESLL